MLAKKYNPSEVETRLMEQWQKLGIYHFDQDDGSRPVYSVDTPPATVSGNLHLGHVYSYSHPDFVIRYQRMKGKNIYYPMGFDDNGLPTERLIEKRLGLRAHDIGRPEFIQKCLTLSSEAELEYEALWKRLGLSIDWRFTYRTIDENSRRISQLSFLELYEKGLIYQKESPTIWCPECQTAIAQADLEDLDRQTEFVTLDFKLTSGGAIQVATTRPELLPACVAVFVHPDDPRHKGLAGKKCIVPLFGMEIPVIEDAGADPEKGTGAVMCCTFGDTADVAWWRKHNLPNIQAIGSDGRMTEVAGRFVGLQVVEARRQIKQALQEAGFLIGREPVAQSVRVHERCDTPVEYIVTRQWFINLLDHQQALLQAGEQVSWHPESMKARYHAWVENLNWDWCISRQRFYGVPVPVWYCSRCGEANLPERVDLPVDPLAQKPSRPCACGSTDFIPDQDVFDTWATSSMTPQIAGSWLADRDLYAKVFPFSLRPQAHEIIRTWAFYSIVKSLYHFGDLPWSDVLISGWGIAGEGMGKISKSRGGGPMPPVEMIERYSADAVRYWAASTSPGKDSVISEEKIQAGSRWVTKLWNVARFSERFLSDDQRKADSNQDGDGSAQPVRLSPFDLHLSPADRWILSRLQTVVANAARSLENYDYASAKNEIEMFFWGEVTDNYLEMCKQRLYNGGGAGFDAAQYTLRTLLLSLLKLLAPFLPFVTEEIFLALFAEDEGTGSIHLSEWPQPDDRLIDPQAELLGTALMEIATAVRRYKSEHNLPLGTELDRLQLAVGDHEMEKALNEAFSDLESITRAKLIGITSGEGPDISRTLPFSIQINIIEAPIEETQSPDQ